MLPSSRKPLQEAGGLVAAVRRHLGGAERARCLVEQEQVGEGAADIDADDRLAALMPGLAAQRRRRGLIDGAVVADARRRSRGAPPRGET